MRQICSALSFLLIFCTFFYGQWDVLNEGIKGRLNTIDFVDENVGWIAGDHGLLLKSEDGGQTWQALPQNTNWYFREIDFITDSIGWAIDNHSGSPSNTNGLILKTQDSGRSWILQNIKMDIEFNSICMVNDSVGYTAGNSSGDIAKIFKTLDSGQNWIDISPPNQNKHIESVRFLNSQAGIAAGYSYESDEKSALVWNTCDGGKSWKVMIFSELEWIRNLQVVNDTTYYFLASIDDTNHPSLICMTTDMFKTWTVISREEEFPNIGSFFFLDDNRICALPRRGLNRGIRGNFIFNNSYIAKSCDDGITWQQKLPSGPWGLNRIYFCSDSIGFAIGGGTLLRSLDGGEHWEVQKFTYPFEDISFIDKDRGFACGGWQYMHIAGGDMFITKDGGKTWEPDLIGMEQKFERILFVNDSLGFALSWAPEDKSRLFRTIDGGNTWTSAYISSVSNESFSGIDIFFINENLGWVVGDGCHNQISGAAIMATINGGHTWNFVWLNPPDSDAWEDLYSICFNCDTTGWAVGTSGAPVKYTTQNGWQEKAKLTDLPLNKVAFIDENTGFIAGGYGNSEEFIAKLFKTKNAGESWDEISGLPYLINDLYFVNSLHGWAVGSDKNESGGILSTSDGGDNWIVEIDGLIGPLHALSFRDGFLWAVGDYGLVLRLELATAREDYSHKYPSSSFKLFQNYPNPFNPMTIIKYTVGANNNSPTFVDLSIYNILGQKVATLVSEKQRAGHYKVEWDASGFVSGVYFYKLSANQGFAVTRKLILLK